MRWPSNFHHPQLSTCDTGVGLGGLDGMPGLHTSGPAPAVHQPACQLSHQPVHQVSHQPVHQLFNQLFISPLRNWFRPF